MYTVSNLKDSISGILTGLNLTNVDDLDGKIERAARTLVQKADIIEATSRLSIDVYDHVFDYSPSGLADIFGSVVYDLRPQGNSRNDSDYVYKQGIEPFDRTKLMLPNGVQLTFEYNKGTPIVRIVSARAQNRAVLDAMSGTTGWTASGSASGLTIDNNDYYESPASLRFLLTGASTGKLTKTINAGDLSDYKGVGVGFLALKIPSNASAASLLSSVSLLVGSSSTAFTTVSATTGFLSAWVVGQWLLVALDLSTGVDTLTPDYTKIAYVQVQFVHTATITNMRVGGLWLSLASPYEFMFGSAAIFMASGTNPSRTIEDDEDQILLNDAAYTLFQWEAAKEIAMGQGGTLASGQIKMIEQRLDVELYPQYRADNPSQEIRTIGNYYDD